MAVFSYIASDESSADVSGVIIADTPRQARDQLRERGFDIQQIIPQQPARGRRWWQRQIGRRRSAKVISIIREISTLLAVGIPLLETLDTVARQRKGALATSLISLRDRVAGGSTLADAMRQQPDVFGDLCAEITEVGENAGTLETTLAQLAEFEERSLQFKSRITTALLYPLLVLLTGIAVSIFLMTFVVPNLLNALVQANRPLPVATRIVKGFSDFLVARWWLLLLVAIVIAGMVMAGLANTKTRMIWHRFQLRLPILGELVCKQAMVRIAIVISTLLRSGIVFVRAVEVARRSTSNLVLKDALERYQKAVDSGRDLSLALEATGVFPPVVVQVFAVGQQSGRLEEMLDRLAQDYDRDVALAAQRLTSILEPLLILFLALLVGLVAFATVLPILEAGNVI